MNISSTSLAQANRRSRVGRPSRNRSALTLLACFLFCSVAFSQEKPTDTTNKNDYEVTKLPAMIITASGISERAEQVPQTIQLYGQDELVLQRSRSLVDFFSENSIGFAATVAPGHSFLSMRGAITNQNSLDDASEIAVLINGRRAGTDNLSKLSPLDAYRIEVLRGPSSVIYGSSAIGGVINLISKNGLNSPGTKLSASAGSWDRYTGGFESGGRQDKLDYYFGAQYQTSGDYQTGRNSPGDGVLLNTNYKRRTANLTLGYALCGTTRAELIVRTDGLYHVGHRGLTYSPTDFDDRYNYSTELKLDGTTANQSVQWSAHTYYAVDVEKWDWSQNPLLSPFSSPTLGNRPGIQRDDNTRQNYVLGQKFSATAKLAAHNTLLSGLDLEATRLRNNRVREGAPGYVEGWRPNPVGQPTVRTSPVNIAPVNLNYNSDVWALYLEDTQKLRDDRLTLKGGLRYDVRNQGLQHTLYEPVGVNTATKRSAAVTYRLGANYQATDWLTLRANLGTSFRTPTPNELNGDSFVGNGIRIIGNPNLKNEQALGWELGASAAKGPFTGELTYFESDISNRIGLFANAAATTASGFTSSINSNLAHVRTEGMEGRLAYDLARPLGLTGWRLEPFLAGNYNFRFKVDDPVYRSLNNNQHILRVSAYQSSVGLRVGRHNKWEGSLVGLLTGPTYENGQPHGLINANYPTNPATNQPILTWVFKKDAYWLVNARASYQATGRVRLFGGINNLLNLNYDPVFLALNEVNARYTVNPYKSQSRSSTGSSSPGREYFAGLEISF